MWASRPRLTRSKPEAARGGPDLLRAVAEVVERDGDAAVARPRRGLVAAAGRERRGGEGEDEQEEGAAGHGRQRLFRMLCRLMRRPLLLLALPVVAAAAVACGSEEIDVAKTEPELRRARRSSLQRCAACHSLDVAGTQGSAVNANKREYKDGPNFDQRKEEYDQVLYAIRNGGFSSGPMPQNIVVGKEAEEVARFVAKYSGKQADKPASPD